MSQNIKILSYNIHKGFALTQKPVLEAIRESIRHVGADLVFLQEVQPEHEGHRAHIQKWPENQLEYLADSIWPHYAYGKNAVYDAGHHGNAILSKFPIINHHNIDISNNSLERRGLLHAIIETTEGPAHLLNVHLDLTANGRSKQSGKIIQEIQTIPKDKKLILAGDFNDWRGQLTTGFENQAGLIEAFIAKTGKHARTFPSIYPLLTLDRVYLRGFEPVEALVHRGTPWSRLSDHLAVEVTIKHRQGSG